MTLLFHGPAEDAAVWVRNLRARIPDIDVRVWPDAGVPQEVEFALLSQPEPGALARFPNLRAVFADGAGVEGLIANPDLAPGVPVVRLVDPDQAREMAEWAIYAVLHFHRRMPAYAAQRAAGQWRSLGRTDSTRVRIGVMGLGLIGAVTARRLAALEFDVAGWSRGPKSIAGVRCFHGREAFAAFLGRTDMLVCVLPLTPATQGIIDRRALAALPRGAHVINLARGGHVVEADLLAALEDGHIAGAALDVFETEPLPRGHPFWSHPKVLWTPHIAGFVDPGRAADQVAENIRRVRAGRPLLNIVDPGRGY